MPVTNAARSTKKKVYFVFIGCVSSHISVASKTRVRMAQKYHNTLRAFNINLINYAVEQ